MHTPVWSNYQGIPPEKVLSWLFLINSFLSSHRGNQWSHFFTMKFYNILIENPTVKLSLSIHFLNSSSSLLLFINECEWIYKFVYAFFCCWTPGLFPCYGYYEWGCSLWTFLCKSCCGYSLSFLLGKYPGVEMLIIHAASLLSVNCHRSYCLRLSSPAF